MIPIIKIVRQYERLAVFTLGKFNSQKGLTKPGLRILFWPIQTSTTVDLREEVIDIPRQTNITSDNAPLNIDFLVFMRPIESEAQKLVSIVMILVQHLSETLRNDKQTGEIASGGACGGLEEKIN